MTKTSRPAPFALFLLSAFLALPGCPHPTPEPGKPGVIDCTLAAVRDRGLELIPKVNDCLQDMGDWQGCLIGLIDPAVGITETVIACVVRSNGAAYARAEKANPNDLTSAAGAHRARAFLQERGYVFAGPAPGGGPGPAGGQ